MVAQEVDGELGLNPATSARPMIVDQYLVGKAIKSIWHLAELTIHGGKAEIACIH